MKKNVSAFLTLMLLLFASNSFAAGKIFDGYGETRWGTTHQKVMETYQKGKLGEYDKQFVYLQENPDDTIDSRLFAFKDGKLTSVAVTFKGKYVADTGLEKLKQQYIKKYGPGKAGIQSKKAHMITHYWEGKQTRISFIWVPNRPEMTVLQFEKI